MMRLLCSRRARLSGGRGGRAGSPGWVVLEVMIAVLIAGVLLGPLAGALHSTGAQSARAREQTEAAGRQGLDPGSAAAWTWGPSVSGVVWLPWAGLEVRAYAAGLVSDRLWLGVWVDGWFQGEYEADSSGYLAIPATVWSGLAGSEATVRARGTEGGWGPPWRWLITEEPASLALTGSSMGDDSVRMVLHTPVAAAASVVTSWAGAVVAPAHGTPLVFSGAHDGPASAAVDGVIQSWTMEKGRELDVYF